MTAPDHTPFAIVNAAVGLIGLTLALLLVSILWLFVGLDAACLASALRGRQAVTFGPEAPAECVP